MVPDTHYMPFRLDAVLTVIYLIFNEGYAATRGTPLVRTDLSAEAIRLGRLVRTLIAPAPPEATALVALMLLHDSRRDARADEDGNLVVLEEQDRGKWDRRQIAEALPMVEEALADRARSRCRRRLRRCTARRRTPRTPTGRRSSGSTIGSIGCSRRRSWR